MSGRIDALSIDEASLHTLHQSDHNICTLSNTPGGVLRGIFYDLTGT